MKYICLIYTPEVEMTEAEIHAEIGAYMAFGQAIQEGGVATGNGEALQPTMTATTVKIRDGKMVTSDGPFAETKEQLSGYYVLDCKDIDEALKYAAQIPGALNGAIEVRPLMVFDQ